MKQERIELPNGYYLESDNDGDWTLRLKGCGYDHAERFSNKSAINFATAMSTDAARVQLLAKALQVARENIEAWRKFYDGADQGIGYKHSDLALQTIDAALKEAGMEG